MQRGLDSASARGAAVLPSGSGGSPLPNVRPFVATVVCAALAVTPSLARADVDFQFATAGGVKWMRALPTLRAEAATTSARELPEQDVATGGAVTALGGSFDLGVVLDDHWIVPGFGFGVYAAIGSYPTILTSADGSIAHVRPWTMIEADLLLPGIGYRVKRRRFMFSAALRTGASFMRVSGSIAGAVESQPVALRGVSAMVQAELEACRRLDPVTRLCLQIAPRLYDFGGLNGATFGVRVEWGR